MIFREAVRLSVNIFKELLEFFTVLKEPKKQRTLK